MLRMPLGSNSREALMAACTSRAAALMSRSRSNWIMIRVLPWLLRLFIWLMPAMVPSERSNGVATLDAMICGLAPGRLARPGVGGESIFRRRPPRQQTKAAAAEQQNRQAQQQGRHRPADKGRGEVHRLTTSPAALRPLMRRDRRSKYR